MATRNERRSGKPAPKFEAPKGGPKSMKPTNATGKTAASQASNKRGKR